MILGGEIQLILPKPCVVRNVKEELRRLDKNSKRRKSDAKTLEPRKSGD